MADLADGEGGRAAANAMAGAGRDDIKHKLTQKSHGRGTPTPSAPGTPPAQISGALAGSVTATPASGGGGTWTAYAGPHGIVYANIQHRGGQAGRNHATHLPPRPYMDVDTSRVERAGADAFHRIVTGG